MFDSLQPCGPEPARLLCLWDFPDKIPGVGCHFLFQGIFVTQGSNMGLLCWQVNSLPSKPPGKPLTARRCNQKIHRELALKKFVLVTQLCLTLRPHGLWPTRLFCPWNSPGKNTGVGSHFFFSMESSRPHSHTYYLILKTAVWGMEVIRNLHLIDDHYLNGFIKITLNTHVRRVLKYEKYTAFWSAQMVRKI